MRLDVLLDGFADAGDAAALEIDELTLDSRAVTPRAAFVALAGATTHGLRHADAALARGAGVVLFEPPAPADIAVPAPAIAVPELRATLGDIANRFYDAPSQALTVIGVTGTNGKTSTVQLLAQAFTDDGATAGSIGTLGTGLHGKLDAGERTTPDVLGVHAALAAMRDAGASLVAMEVSSHALHQGRVDAVAFDVAVFTNLTRDHLDYHGDMDAYGAAKALLFAWPTLRAAVVNLDDAFGRALFDSTKSASSSVSSSSLRKQEVLLNSDSWSSSSSAAKPRWIAVTSHDAPNATLRADTIELDATGVRFTLVHAEQRILVRSNLLGRFNIDNLLAVAGTLLALDWPLKKIATAIEHLDPVPGRMSRLGGDSTTPLIVVDYAHTPDALEQALTTLRAHTNGALICVFGCGGERDRGKRPQMARIAETAADTVIVTDDNPRRESGDAIVAEILAGFAAPDAVQVQRDRARAIAAAIAAARIGDTVLIAGKGHEPYQEIDGIKHAFDDLAHARAALTVALTGARA